MDTLTRLNNHLSGPKWSEATHLVPPIVCSDGFRMSIQASRYHYCSPRSDLGPWTHVEIGFPSAIENLILEYAEDERKDFTNTVYPQVPIELVVKVIDKHGGSFQAVTIKDW